MRDTRPDLFHFASLITGGGKESGFVIVTRFNVAGRIRDQTIKASDGNEGRGGRRRRRRRRGGGPLKGS